MTNHCQSQCPLMGTEDGMIKDSPGTVRENSNDGYNTKSSIDSGYYAPSLVSSSTRSSSASILSGTEFPYDNDKSTGEKSANDENFTNSHFIKSGKGTDIDLLNHVGKTMPDIDWKMIETHLKVSQLEHNLPEYMIDREAIRAKLAADSSSEDEDSYSEDSNHKGAYRIVSGAWEKDNITGASRANDVGDSNIYQKSYSQYDCRCPVWATKMRHHERKHNRRLRLLRATANKGFDLLANHSSKKLCDRVPTQQPTKAHMDNSLAQEFSMQCDPGSSSFNLQICFMNDPVPAIAVSNHPLDSRDGTAPMSNDDRLYVSHDDDTLDKSDRRSVTNKEPAPEIDFKAWENLANQGTNKRRSRDGLAQHKTVLNNHSPMGKGCSTLMRRRHRRMRYNARRRQAKHLQCLLYPLVAAASRASSRNDELQSLHCCSDLASSIIKFDAKSSSPPSSPVVCCGRQLVPPYSKGLAPRDDLLTRQEVKRSDASGTSGSDEYEEFYEGILDTSLASSQTVLVPLGFLHNNREETRKPSPPLPPPALSKVPAMLDRQQEIQEQARLALSQAPLMAKMQLEVEKELKKLSLVHANGATNEYKKVNGSSTAKNGIAERASTIIKSKIFRRCKNNEAIELTSQKNSAEAISSIDGSSTASRPSPVQSLNPDPLYHYKNVFSIPNFPAATARGVTKRTSLTTLKSLCNMPIAQLQILAERYLSQIEGLNEELVQLLMERDELHMEQDSILVDIEDITGRVKDNRHYHHHLQENSSQRVSIHEGESIAYESES